MAFTTTQENQTVFGDKRVMMGSYHNTAGSTGGTFNTGLGQVHFILFCPGDVAAGVAPVITHPLPTTTGNVTIATLANSDGGWMAFGK